MSREFDCMRCDGHFNSKGSLVKHLKRANCQPTKADVQCEVQLSELTKRSLNDKTYDCDNCGKSFNDRRYKHKHMKNCKVGDDSAEAEQHNIPVISNNAANGTGNMGTSVNQSEHVNIKQVQNQNITVNAFGKEDISYLTEHPNFKRYMLKCVKENIYGICDFLIRKHFDEKHPENHNIKKRNKKDEFMEVFDGRKWKLKYIEDILGDVFQNMYIEFANFIEEALTEDGMIKKAWLDRFMASVGQPLDWDFSNEDYEYNEDISEEKKEILREKIFKLACEYVYRHSRAKVLV